MQIVITIRGGVIENVFCTSPQIDCVVIDWDEDAAENQNRSSFPVDPLCMLHPEAVEIIAARNEKNRITSDSSK